jgi:hypothetical protein
MAMKLATRSLLVLLCVSVSLWFPSSHGTGQDTKKPDKKAEPKVLVVIPLGAAPGKTTRLTIRGHGLDRATALSFPGVKAAVKIVSKGTAAVPEKNPEKGGDTQLVADVTLPADLPAGSLPLVVATPSGDTKPHPLLIEMALPVIAEKEPNDGFRQAQPIQVPQAIDGLIERPKDVDVFRLKGKAGQRLVCEVLAARHGSALDSVLTLYDADGRQVAVNDDFGGSVDSRLEVTLPRDGVYFLSLIDALDQGGPAHVYRLVVRFQK